MSLLRRHISSGGYSPVIPPIANTGSLRGVASGSALTGSQTYVDDIFQWGGNYMYAFLGFTALSAGTPLAKTLIPAVVSSIESRLLYLRSLGMKVIIDLTGSSIYWYGQPGKQTNAFWNYDDIYGTTESIMADFWREMAVYLSPYDDVVHAFKIHDEPLDETYNGSNPVPPANWWSIAQSITNSVREVNTNIHIGFQPGPGGTNWAYYDLQPLYDPANRVLYFVHGYGPLKFTHQGIDGLTPTETYPMLLSPPTFEIAYAQTYTGLVYGSAYKDYWDQDTMRYINYKHARDFQLANGNPPMMNVFSAVRWAPGTETGAGSAQFMKDTIDLMEEWGWHWVFWLHDPETRAPWGLQYDEGASAFTPIGGTATKTVFGERAAVIWDGLRLNNYLTISGLASEVNEDTTIPSFTVTAYKSADDTVNTFLTSDITISIVSGSGTLSGQVTKPLSGGSVSFTDLQINNPGPYVLRASADTGATSSDDNIIVNQYSSSVYTDDPFIGWGGEFVTGHLAAGTNPSDYQTYIVNTTAATGTGSLYSALKHDPGKPKLIVFSVEGTIDWSSITDIPTIPGRTVVNTPNMTIAGQTAPGKGIHIVNGSLLYSAGNQVAQHFSIYGIPPAVRDDVDTIGINASNIVIDHVLVAWGTDEGIGIAPGDLRYYYGGVGVPTSWRNHCPHNITVSNSIIFETLEPTGNEYATKSILVNVNSSSVAFQRCLLGSNGTRNPQFDVGTRGCIVNSVVYNFYLYGMTVYQINEPGNYGNDPQAAYLVEKQYVVCEGNLYQAGPDTLETSARMVSVNNSSCNWEFLAYQEQTADIFLHDNLYKRRDLTTNITEYSIGDCQSPSGVSILRLSDGRPSAAWHSSITPTLVPASQVKALIASNVGPRPWKARNSVELRAVQEMLTGGGSQKSYSTRPANPSYPQIVGTFNSSDWNLNVNPITKKTAYS